MLLVAVLLAVSAWVWRRPAAPETLDPGTYRVERAVDGDTLQLANGARVRLIGVDTPETKHPDRGVEFYGPEAADFTHRLVAGREVRLEFDRERTDRHGRFLAYVYVDDLFLNEELIRRGFGRAALQFPYSSQKKRLFKQAEAEAREARRGLWSR